MLSDTFRLLVTLDPLLLALGPLLMGWAALMQWHRDGRVSAAARALGAGYESARFVARQLRSLPPREAVAMLDAPELLADLLAQKLKAARSAESATTLADAARNLLIEMDALLPPFEGAPRLFEAVTLGDGSDTPSIRGHVCSIDERNLGVLAHRRCPWPVRTVLVVTRKDTDTGPFTAWLLLRPMPGHHEWVLSHELSEDQHNRRISARVPVEIPSWSLDASERVGAARERLRRGDRLELGRLRRTDAWPRRHRIRIRDLSPDGALLDVDHEVGPGDRFHLVIPADDVAADRDALDSGEVLSRPPADLRIAALPLVEAVSVRLGAGGRLVVGVRFCGMRFKERSALQELVRRCAARHRQALRRAGIDTTGQADEVDLAGGH